jgi:esterase/lipase
MHSVYGAGVSPLSVSRSAGCSRLSGKVAHWTRPGGWLARVSRLPKLGGSDVRDPRTKAENPCYDGIPTRALGELMTFMKVTDDALPRITQPVLVLHATQDHTAPVACAQRIAERAHAKRVRILPRSYHLIAVDVERDIVAAEVIDFLRNSGE